MSMKTVGRAVLGVGLLLLAALSMPMFALAATQADQPPGPVLTGLPLKDVVIGVLTPLVGYVLNHYAPWVTEQVKGIVQAVIAAGAASLFQILGAGTFGWNQQTLVAVLTAMGAALAAHMGYKAAGINVALGAGVNHDGRPVKSKVVVKATGPARRRKA